MITIEQQGRRYYLAGDTYPHRDAIGAIGAHWDAGRKAWWTAKGDDARALVARLNQVAEKSGPSSAAQRSGDGDATVVAGKAEYRGKTYYVVGRVVRGRTHWDDRVAMIESRDGARVLLSYRDGARTFWAPTGLDPAATVIRPSDIGGEGCARITSRYERPKTIGSLRAYAADLKAGRVATCPQCGSPSCDGARGGHCEED